MTSIVIEGKTLEEINELSTFELTAFKEKYCSVFKAKCKGEECHSFYFGKVIGKRLYLPMCCSPLVTGTIEHEEP